MATDALIGARLGNYHVDEFIGRGGMGVVYRAEHVTLGRRVALKLLAPELAQNASFRERFVRESKLAAAIDHPNVIPIYEAGEADAQPFIAMRYVDGVDLREILHTQGPLDIDRALLVLSQVSGALDAAHAGGLVHRDVKPGNILVVRGFDHCYLTDFGLTKAVSSNTHFTATGQFVGTTDYVAPEQIEGRELDRRTDVYSLGCVFYECLAGGPPFRRDNDMAVMWAHIQEPPPRLTERRPDLPAQLDEVIATAMAKSKDDRYPSCSTFAAAARSALELGTGRSFAAIEQRPLPVAPQPQAPAAHTEPDIAPPNAWQGPPEAGYAPAWTPGPPPAGEGGGHLTAIAVVIAALLLAAAGTAAALIITGKDKPAPKQQAVAPPTRTVVRTTQEPSGGKPTRRSRAPQPQPPRRATPPAPPPAPAFDDAAAADAKQALRDYWYTLRDDDYNQAFDYWNPPPDTRTHWVGLRRNDGLYDVTFKDLTPTAATSSRVAINAEIETLQDSCRPQSWMFEYVMVENGGRWQIASGDAQNKPPC